MLNFKLVASKFKLDIPRFELKRRQLIEVEARLAAKVAVSAMADLVPSWTGFAKASLRGMVTGFDNREHRMGLYFGGVSDAQLVPIRKAQPRSGLLRKVPWKEPWKTIENGRETGHYILNWTGKNTITFQFSTTATNFEIAEKNGLPSWSCLRGKTHIWRRSATRVGTYPKWGALKTGKSAFEDRLVRGFKQSRLVLGDYIIREKRG
jgi:hypothetical protein